MKKATFKSELFRYLKQNKIAQSQLAEKAGISPASLSRYLAGKRDLFLGTAEKLKEAMKW